MSESAFRRASAGATVFGIAVCPPAGAAASAGAVDTLVSFIPQIIGIEAAAEMLAQAGKAMLSKLVGEVKIQFRIKKPGKNC